MSGTPVECAACRAGLPMIWFVQGKKYMHEAPGLSVMPCAVREERERRARDIANDRGNEDQRGR